ncbi:hypothetical protein LX36DRAFT_651974 [Colletotrichum falcatum]|nr:hypothetical protein LX36DRAFT_651974 [Colletotrichum falcatum]
MELVKWRSPLQPRSWVYVPSTTLESPYPPEQGMYRFRALIIVLAIPKTLDYSLMIVCIYQPSDSRRPFILLGTLDPNSSASEIWHPVAMRLVQRPSGLRQLPEFPGFFVWLLINPLALPFVFIFLLYRSF